MGNIVVSVVTTSVTHNYKFNLMTPKSGSNNIHPTTVTMQTSNRVYCCEMYNKKKRNSQDRRFSTQWYFKLSRRSSTTGFKHLFHFYHFCYQQTSLILSEM